VRANVNLARNSTVTEPMSALIASCVSNPTNVGGPSAPVTTFGPSHIVVMRFGSIHTLWLRNKANCIMAIDSAVPASTSER